MSELRDNGKCSKETSREYDVYPCLVSSTTTSTSTLYLGTTGKYVLHCTTVNASRFYAFVRVINCAACAKQPAHVFTLYEIIVKIKVVCS